MRDEQGSAGVHHRHLHSRMRRSVGGARACSHRPGIARQASLYIQGGLCEYLTLVNGRTASNQDDRAAVRRGIPDVAEAGLQLGGAEMHHQDIIARRVHNHDPISRCRPGEPRSKRRITLWPAPHEWQNSVRPPLSVAGLAAGSGWTKNCLAGRPSSPRAAANDRPPPTNAARVTRSAGRPSEGSALAVISTPRQAMAISTPITVFLVRSRRPASDLASRNFAAANPPVSTATGRNTMASNRNAPPLRRT
jgi:hypothetical protein